MFLYPAYASALLPSSTAGIREIYLQWLTLVVVGKVHLGAVRQLAKLSETAGGARLFARGGKGGVQQGCKKRNNPQYDQQFHQRESVSASHRRLCLQ
jgi:hypothetical protein